MAAAAVRVFLLAAGLLGSLLLLAGCCQLICGLYLLLKAPQPAVNGSTIAAGVWDILIGLVTVTLCFTGPLRASRRSQLQLAAFCSAPAVNAALGVVIGLVPSTEQSSDVRTVFFISAVSTAVAATASFIAANLVFCMQLLFHQFHPGTQAWTSPKSVSSGASSFLFSQTQMTQKAGAPDLWRPNGMPLASWVYHTQSSTDTARCETRLDAPPPPAPPADHCATTEFRAAGPRAVEPPQHKQPRHSSSGSSLVLRTAPASAFRASDVPTPSSADGGAAAARLPRCLSLLSAIYGRSRGGWPPTERQLRSFSLLEVRPPPAGAADRPASSDALLLSRPLVTGVTVDEASEPGSPPPFPPAPVPLRASPLPTPVTERAPPTTPLAGTIGRLATVLSRLHSDPDYRASRELEEALQALQALELTPAARLTAAVRPGGGEAPERPSSAASHASSSGYGSPDGSKEGPPQPPPPPASAAADYQRRSVVQLVGLMERERQPGPVGRRTDSGLRRPAVPPPPPPTGVPPAAALMQSCPAVTEPSAKAIPDSRPDRPVVESEC